MAPAIERIETIEFGYELEDVGTPPGGFDVIYDPGARWSAACSRSGYTSTTAASAPTSGSNSPGAAQINTVADYLIGKDPLTREKHWSELKRALRKYDRMGIGPLDVALWDYAGSDTTRLSTNCSAPTASACRLTPPPTRVTKVADSTPRGLRRLRRDVPGPGYQGFKLHGWDGDWRDVDELEAAVRAVGERVGDEMDLMVDPACDLDTFADALQVGRACDDHGYFWYEDPIATAVFPSTATANSARNWIRRCSRPNTSGDWSQRPTSSPTRRRTSCAPTRVRRWHHRRDKTRQSRRGVRYRRRDSRSRTRPAPLHGRAPERELLRDGAGPSHRAEHDPAGVRRGLRRPSWSTVDDDGTVPVPDGPGLGVDYDWDYVLANETGRREYS